MLRIASIITITDENLEEYKKLHQAVWNGVKDRIKKSNIQNYSIHYKDNMLFSYFEYVGEDYEKDMEDMEKDDITQKWWSICKPLQTPVKNRLEKEWWASMEEIFFLE